MEVAIRRLTVLLAAAVVAGCASNAGAAAGSPKLSVRLIVAPTIASGSSVTAHIVIDNRTGRAIPVTDCGGLLYQVVLENSSHHQGASWLQCATNDSIPPGVSVRTIPVLTRYNGCGAGFIPCNPDGSVPLLPPGTYHAQVAAVSPQLPTAPDVTVQILPAR